MTRPANMVDHRSGERFELTKRLGLWARGVRDSGWHAECGGWKIAPQQRVLGYLELLKEEQWRTERWPEEVLRAYAQQLFDFRVAHPECDCVHVEGIHP